jgi:hypothetical protein
MAIGNSLQYLAGTVFKDKSVAMVTGGGATAVNVVSLDHIVSQMSTAPTRSA